MLSSFQLKSSSVKFRNLTTLDLEGNQLSTLPPEIGQLHNLTELDLTNNQLRTLPPEIGQLQNLTELDLSNNQLTEFPQILLKLNMPVEWGYCFRNICITGNPFQIPPVEIVKQGRQAIIDYYAALEQQQQPVHEAKLILIGDGAAGKTSLMKRLLGQAFDPQESQTHGININTLTLLDQQQNEIKLHCWDFGGQQVMHATHQFFLSKRCLYLLVIDARRESKVDYWLDHVQAFGGLAPVLIVINKIDENPHFNLSLRQLKQRYPNLKHINRISCYTKAGLDELKTTIQATLPDIELLHTRFPTTWFQVKTAIVEQAQHTNFTSYEHYVDICQAHGINDESAQNTLINFLHDLGIIHHFQDRWLQETNVINPQWLTEAVYTIINAAHLAGNGKLKSSDLKKLLDATIYPVRKHDYILEVMKKFEICYSLNANEYLLPDLFSTDEPNFSFDDTQALYFILEYNFLPKSVFTRFIIRMHNDILDNTYWRTGVLLQEPTTNTKALVETANKRITLQINGPQQREYLSILRFTFNDIHRRFNQLNVVEKICLPDNPQLSVNYDYLLKLQAKGQTEYLPPEDASTSYKISELLGIVAPPTESEMLVRLDKIIRMLEAQGFKEEQDLIDHIDEIITINPSLFGVRVNVNELLKKLFAKKS
ncbi:hypothetical protein TI04_06910 [Achromatium sp. WMS2]|nr:hypothetical protein TI04_06910 [Achromatium sp. WMS2]